ncbi:hypothetical protein P153DRAFT_420844 [Dothidotthia symphoricarpi CBS 119687]|uniref:Uncharacterized protein n=1 Tax=Dothidotthia symphoricarpi CBS 119687 TaxID=1392245 RepID=A0A6A6APU6_9PLEO|nr:uncharacterized protein P153DRAFT_420844 [Dothidotthia symphoricarpi CBS 119687]KAF2132964.1 hypothetical protein P153DRAFT_420844 [Dothidotthia symphoricarpi CBS 119687]
MVYITSDLFGPAPTHSRVESTPLTHWNIMVDSQHTSGLGKRRRQDRDESPSTNYQRLSPSNRPSHRNAPSCETNTTRPYPSFAVTPPYTTSDRRPIKQIKRLSPKLALVKSTSHLMDLEPDVPTPHAHPVSDLRPCHACSSAPKRKRDLDGFMDCKRCDNRTCYICARQCFGGCGKAVCKKCIVEVGIEGDPWCLDCYSRDINK